MESKDDKIKKEESDAAGEAIEEIDNTAEVDFQQAVQNLTDVLIDQEKFSMMAQKFFQAMDEDNLGFLYVKVVLNFIN